MCADSTNTMVIVPNLRFLGFICVIVSIASGSLPGPLASNDLGAAFSQSIDRSTFRKSKDRYTSTVHSNLLTVDPTLHEHFDKYQFTVPSALYDNVDRYSLHVKPKLHQSTYRYLSTVYSFNRIHYGDSDSHYKCLYESSECSSLVQHTSHYPINLARLQSHILWICFSGFMFFMIRTRLSLTKPTNPSTNIAQNARNITPYLPLIIYHLFMISTPHLVVSTVISPQQKLTAVYNPTDNDRFAWGLDVYGDYALIGAYGDNPKGTQSGSVYVFQQHDDQWNVTQRLFPDDGGYMDNFGRTVCVYDSYAFIAAPYDNDMGSDSGSVYIYSNVDDIWTQSVKLTPDDLTDNAFFGWDIAMYHDYALIGAPSWWGSSPKGSAYFYQKVNDSWTFVMKVSPDTPVTAGFGVSVAMWDDHAIIGAYEDTDDSGNITVSAYVYQKVNDIWSQTAKLIPSDGTSGEDMNGLPVSIYANYAVIGASYSNSIYIFENVNGVWTETQSISGESSGDKFGRDVVMYGQYILVGAEAANDGKGKGYAFKNINGTWSLWDTFIAADGTFSDRFAYSISVYNNVVFFGAHKKNNYQGAAYFTALNPHYSYCDFYSPAIKPETENTVASNLHVYEVMEISFDLTVHNNWTCPHTVCHLFQIGTSLYDSYPRLPLLGMPDATEGVLFHVPYSDALDRNTKINYDEDTYYNIIYDGNTHSVYFRFSGTQRIFAVDGEVVRQTNGEYNSSQYYGDGYGLFVTNTGSPSYVPDVTMTDFCVYSDTEAPTKSPSPAPSSAPSHSTNHPSLAPSSAPTNAPSLVPSSAPTIPPSNAPSFAPSVSPSIAPSVAPTLSPTTPTFVPTATPTRYPTYNPTGDPTMEPTYDPTNDPTINPTMDPTTNPTNPTNSPTIDPTRDPTIDPTMDPTIDPTYVPTFDPTLDPTIDPTMDPTIDPTYVPTFYPTIDPTINPTTDPTVDPTRDPTIDPTTDPTMDPTSDPTRDPTTQPTTDPTTSPTVAPSIAPTGHPSSFAELLDGLTISGEAGAGGFQGEMLVTLGLGSLSLFILVLAVFTKRNDDQDYEAVALYLLQCFDLYSDVILAALLYNYYLQAQSNTTVFDEQQIGFLALLCWVCILSAVIPYFLNIFTSIRIIGKLSREKNIPSFTKDYFDSHT
eukprot:655573_1